MQAMTSSASSLQEAGEKIQNLIFLDALELEVGDLLDIYAALFPELDDIVEAVVVADDEVVLVRICRRERTEIAPAGNPGHFLLRFLPYNRDPRFGSLMQR